MRAGQLLSEPQPFTGVDIVLHFTHDVETTARLLLRGHSSPGAVLSPLWVLTHFILKLNPQGRLCSSSDTKPEHQRNAVLVNYASVILLSHCVAFSKGIFIFGSISACRMNGFVLCKEVLDIKQQMGKL